jgi:hypothetical protein
MTGPIKKVAMQRQLDALAFSVLVSFRQQRTMQWGDRFQTTRRCEHGNVGRPRACKRLTHQAEPDRNGTTSPEILAGAVKQYRDHCSISRTRLANKSLRR